MTTQRVPALDNYIGGTWRSSASSARIDVCNPAQPDQVVATCPDSSEQDVAAAIGAAREASAAWARTPGPVRGAHLFRLAQLLEGDAADLARIVTLEQGKAAGEARGEVVRAVAEMRYMAGEASRPIGSTFPSERDGTTVTTTAEPIGVVAAVCPWNFPVVTPVRKIAPALAWGNTVVLKPSSLTPWSSLRLAQLAEQAGLPPGVLNVVTGSGRAVGDALISSPHVAGVSFTGSTGTGRHIYERVASRLGRVQLELGGKNPALVHDCSDLEGAAREIVSAAFLCSGQRCTALSRVIVTSRQADALVTHLLEHVDRIVVGDGLDPATTMGPLVSEEQRRHVGRYIEQGKKDGAELVRGGGVPAALADAPGHYLAPTVFDHVTPSMPLATEEIFGPVLPIVRVETLDDAIAVANATEYGLAASIFTANMSVAHRCASEIHTGMIHINHGTASQAHVPFGGVAGSGQGAYSIGPTAREFFTNVKAVYVRW